MGAYHRLNYSRNPLPLRGVRNSRRNSLRRNRLGNSLRRNYSGMSDEEIEASDLYQSIDSLPADINKLRELADLDGQLALEAVAEHLLGNYTETNFIVNPTDEHIEIIESQVGDTNVIKKIYEAVGLEWPGDRYLNSRSNMGRRNATQRTNNGLRGVDVMGIYKKINSESIN